MICNIWIIVLAESLAENIEVLNPLDGQGHLYYNLAEVEEKT